LNLHPTPPTHPAPTHPFRAGERLQYVLLAGQYTLQEDAAEDPLAAARRGARPDYELYWRNKLYRPLAEIFEACLPPTQLQVNASATWQLLSKGRLAWQCAPWAGTALMKSTTAGGSRLLCCCAVGGASAWRPRLQLPARPPAALPPNSLPLLLQSLPPNSLPLLQSLPPNSLILLLQSLLSGPHTMVRPDHASLVSSTPTTSQPPSAVRASSPPAGRGSSGGKGEPPHPTPPHPTGKQGRQMPR
jgi:hypothetical protein